MNKFIALALFAIAMALPLYCPLWVLVPAECWLLHDFTIALDNAQ